MNTTIYEASKQMPYHSYPRPVIVMVGHNREYCIGDIAYRVARPINKELAPMTLPKFASLFPVMYIDGEWRSVYTSHMKRLIKNWSDDVTLIDRE